MLNLNILGSIKISSRLPKIIRKFRARINYFVDFLNYNC